jgi:RNA polymerase sigma-70 factor (ECF subfamily)
LPVSGEASSTSISLLRRVRRRDEEAWQRLCALYGPVVYGWCRRAGLQDSDAADAVQEVFRAIFRGIGDFRGDNEANRQGRSGWFRSWLWTITSNQIRLCFRKQGGAPQAFGGSDAQMRIREQPDGLETPDAAEPDADDATRRRILHRALQLVQNDFTPGTWEAFRRTTVEGRSAREVAADLGLSENAVRQAKFRVLRRLRDELDGQL